MLIYIIYTWEHGFRSTTTENARLRIAPHTHAYIEPLFNAHIIYICDINVSTSWLGIVNGVFHFGLANALVITEQPSQLQFHY